MTSILASGTGSTSTVFANPTSSPIPSTDTAKNLNPTLIAVIVIGSIAFGLLLVVVLIYAPTSCRSRRKYQHPEDRYKAVDSLESDAGVSVSKSYQNGWRPVYEYGRTTLSSTTKNQQSLNRSTVTSDSQYLKDANPWPSSSFVNESEGQAIGETHVASFGAQSQSQGATEPLREFDISTLHSAQPSSSSTIKLAPLTIPERPLSHSSGKRSIKRKGSTQSRTTLDSGLETDDSASLYSEASASTYSSKSSLETIVPPPVPPIPRHLTTSTHSTLPENVDVIVSPRMREEAIIKPSPTTSLFAPLPALRMDKDEVEDGAEIYNVAKLLHSRQSRVPTALNQPSRNSSIVSHIERSGSIKPVIPPPGEGESESYRPRYHRLKQNWNTRAPYPSSSSAPHLGEASVSLLPSSHLRDSSQEVES